MMFGLLSWGEQQKRKNADFQTFQVSVHPRPTSSIGENSKAMCPGTLAPRAVVSLRGKPEF